MSSHRSYSEAGYLLILTLVFGSIFFVIISGFIGYIITENQVVEQRYRFEQAGEIAEAGLNYYRWYLAHYPGDVTAGTGAPGPYVFTYEDPEDGPIGEFSLDIASTTFCNQIASIDVTSTGYTFADPDVERTITARYAQPTVADYAYIINSNVWAGSDREIFGPYHSNQGIRMDGTNYSTVTSGLTDWTCTSGFGCSGNPTVDGVFTSTSNANELLFSFPSAPINFTDLTLDLAAIRNSAQNEGGIYIPFSNAYGYRLTFNGDGTVTARRVTNTFQYWAQSSEGTFQERNIIRNQSFYNTYTIDPACPLIYVDDKVWLEGTLDNRVTLAAAGTDISGDDPDIILQGNITYNTPGDDGLLAIAEDNVLLGVDVPNNMTINGIFVAQNGRFGRNHYNYSWLPVSWGYDYRPFYMRNSLNVNGTIVSNGRVGTKWTSGGTYISGFDNRTNTFDRNLVDNPPPLVPNTSDVYDFVEWREEQ
jgi:hypothetical protein